MATFVCIPKVGSTGGVLLRYNFETKKLDSNDFAMAQYPLVASGSAVTSPSDNHYRVKSGFFTTDNREHPAYRLKATTIEIYPDDRVVMKNVVLYVGDVPLFWVPYFWQDLKDDHATYMMQAGSKTEFGFYVYSDVNWSVNPNLKLTVELDEREKRGPGGGLEARYKPSTDGEGLFRGYFTHDQDYTYNPTSRPRTPVYPERYRFSLQQRASFGQDVTTLVNLNVLSDPYVTEDFFRSEFEHDRMPDSVAEGVFYNPNFTIDLVARQQVNRFQTTTDQLPGVTFENKRVKLFNTDVAYEGQTSIVNFREQFSNQNLSGQTPAPHNYGAYRWDTFHQLLYPKEYFGWLSLTPRVGVRGTEWSNNNEQSPAQRPSATGRALFVTGMEGSFKLSQTWSDVSSHYFAVDGLRHVFEPFVNLQYIPRPDINPTQLNGFDTRLPNVWAQPINLTAYNSIDSMDRQAVARMGVRNKLQTKREGENVDLVDWSLFTDVNFDRHQNEMNQTVDDRISNIYNDVKVKPLPWLSFRSQSAINTANHDYAMTDNGITWQATKFYDFTLGNRYLNNAQIYDNYGVPIDNSNVVYLVNFYRINEHWQVEARHQFEATSGNLQEQEYTLYRDLSAWQAALTFAENEYPGRPSDLSVSLRMTLKAFPEAKVSYSH